MAADKDTIYIDIDDEITAIIDKVRDSDNKVVALVLPKRASVFQSIVNMKLLKRAADSSKKNLVLVTSEAGLLPLAGAAGIHVAPSINAKPEIPQGPADNEVEETVDEAGEQLPQEVTTETAGDKPIGDLAGIPATPKESDVETMELPEDLPAPADAPKKDFKPPKKKDKRLKVPDFNRFRLWLILGGVGLVLLVFLLYLALSVLPKATIALGTNAADVNSSTNLNLLTAADEVDLSDNSIPAKRVEQQKTDSQEVTTTGEKNNGNKAKGSAKFTAQVCGSVQQPSDVPAGTGVSANGLTYITQEDTSFGSNPTIKGSCLYFNSTKSTDITAQNGGSNYNVDSGTSFSVAGRSNVTGTGSASGGTDNIVKVVSQSDIDNAKAKLSTKDSGMKEDLQKQLEDDNYFAIPATFNGSSASVKSSSNVGDTASSVTVTGTVTYSMFGVRESDLETVIDNDIKNQIDPTKQAVISYGLDSATFNADDVNAKGAKLSMQTTAAVGPDLDTEAIKRNAAGKKSGEIRSDLETNPDITSVDVKLSPFWVSSVPKKTSKITVTIQKPNSPDKAGASND